MVKENRITAEDRVKIFEQLQTLGAKWIAVPVKMPEGYMRLLQNGDYFKSLNDEILRWYNPYESSMKHPVYRRVEVEY